MEWSVAGATNIIPDSQTRRGDVLGLGFGDHGVVIVSPAK